MPKHPPLQASDKQPAVKRIGKRPGSAVNNTGKTKALRTGGRPAHRRGR